MRRVYTNLRSFKRLAGKAYTRNLNTAKKYNQRGRKVGSDFSRGFVDLLSIRAYLEAIVEALDVMCIAWPQIRGLDN